MSILRCFGCYDSSSKTAEKCSKLSRHIIFTIAMIATVVAFSYAIVIPVKCNDDVYGKDCALGYAKDICSQSLSAIISLSITVIVICCMLVGCKYTWFLVSLGIGISFQILYIIILWTNENPGILTAR